MEITHKNLDVLDMARRLWSLFCTDSLFRNSVYLMLSTAVMAGFGFIFWVITTHFYTSAQIGFATALISVTVLISNLSLFGFNASLIRYLLSEKKPNELINTAMVVVSVATVVLSVAYLLGIDYFAPSFHMLAANPSYAFLFIVFMIAVSLNTLTDSVFVAYRFSKYNLIVYTFFGLTKIVLPLFLLSFGTYGIFFSYTGAVIVSLFLSLYFMVRRFDYRPQVRINPGVAGRMIRFSLVNYIVAFIAGFPALIAPVLIIDKFGAQDSAYFYMASTIAALIQIIPSAVAQSLFAEGSYKESEFVRLAVRAIRLIAALLIPAVAVIFLFGRSILLIFGEEYSVNSYVLLQIMAISTFFLSINVIGSTTFRIRHKMKMLLIVYVLYLSVTAFLAYTLAGYGTVGISWALTGGQAFMSLCFLTVFFRKIPALLKRSLSQSL